MRGQPHIPPLLAQTQPPVAACVGYRVEHVTHVAEGAGSLPWPWDYALESDGVDAVHSCHPTLAAVLRERPKSSAPDLTQCHSFLALGPD